MTEILVAVLFLTIMLMEMVRISHKRMLNQWIASQVRINDEFNRRLSALEKKR